MDWGCRWGCRYGVGRKGWIDAIVGIDAIGCERRGVLAA